MIAAVDVNYFEDGSALAAAVVFKRFSDESPVAEYSKRIEQVEDYVPGSFYKRELPCILSLLETIEEEIEIIIVDGYVSLGAKPGLGAHLRARIDEGVSVIGVAKSHFAGSAGSDVYRGQSKKPLHVTSAGLDQHEAARLIASMHGEHRIPTLLKTVDRLTKEGSPLR